MHSDEAPSTDVVYRNGALRVAITLRQRAADRDERPLAVAFHRDLQKCVGAGEGARGDRAELRRSCVAQCDETRRTRGVRLRLDPDHGDAVEEKDRPIAQSPRARETDGGEAPRHPVEAYDARRRQVVLPDHDSSHCTNVARQQRVRREARKRRLPISRERCSRRHTRTSTTSRRQGAKK